MVTAVPNVSFHLLDRAVIEGRADDPLVTAGERTWTHARLLEEVAALGGVLRHLGVERGTPVRLALDPGHDVQAVVAALATARLGGVVATEGDADVVVGSQGTTVEAGRARLLVGHGPDPVAEPDLDWSVMLRAGRTDPAPYEPLDDAAAYSEHRTVGEQVAALGEATPPFGAAALRRLLLAP